MKTSLNALHHQDNDWKRELKFYIDELAILTGRLEEVVSHNSNKAVLANVEHFQNKFIMLRERIDILKHQVGEREKAVREIAKEKPEHIDEKMKVVDDKVMAEMRDLAGSIAATRTEFNRFLTRVM